MHKIYAVILLAALVAQNEGVSQGKWSRPIRNTQSDYTRQRRQFLYGEWIPLTKPCPTCRPLVDPLDVGQRPDAAGLVPPRPPTVTRQIHGEGNFFGQDESAVLSVPPPPPTLSGHPSTNFQSLQFQNLASFNSPLSLSSQQIFPPSQPIQFVHQPFLSNQNLLVNSNQPILPVLQNSNGGSVFSSENHGGQFLRNEKPTNFDSNFGHQKFTENVILEQNVRGLGGSSSSVFSSKPTSFPKHQNVLQQNSQQAFSQQQTVLQQNSPQTFTHHQQTVIHQQHSRPQSSQQHNSVKLDDSILTPPPQPAVNGSGQNVVLPGLEKEEIQLLYVPVETLRQRGNLQQQYLLQQQQAHQIRLQQQQHPLPQNVQLQNGGNAVTRPSSTLRPTEPTPTTVPQTNGHFVTDNSLTGGQTLSSIKLSSSHPFSTAPTPSTVFFQNVRSQQTPHPFVSATPISTTESSFITTSPFTQKLVSVTPDTTLPHLASVQNTIPYTTPGIQYVTTPKNVLSQETDFSEEIITGKPQFDSLKAQKFSQPFAYQTFQQGNVHLQSFTSHGFPGTRPTTSTSYIQEQSGEKEAQLALGQQVENQKFTSQKPIDQNQHLPQQQVQENELREQYLLKQRQNKNQDSYRVAQQLHRQNEQDQILLEKQKKQKEYEDQRRKEQEQKRQKEIEQERYLQQQRQSELEEQQRLQQQRQNELEEQNRLQRVKNVEENRFSQQKQRQEDNRERHRWQQQLQHQRQQTNYDQELHHQRQEKQNKQDNKQELYHQRQQQQILQQVHQVQQQQQQGNRNIFSEKDNANFIAQAEQETETENPQLVPHQPPLSVFYKGYGKTEPRITDVLRELRNSRAITVLDQYFEKMPKVFVGPAGLVPPTGYDKYDLPYLSNIENRLTENQKDKLPFFVAPLNFIPPTGYSKIPFPSPHVGSVVISSDSIAAATAKPNEADSSSSEEEEQDERPGTFPLVGPELPGLINGLETEKTTIRTTTPSLPQTTAQLRNRRPISNLYRQRKPVSRTRSTTSTTTTTTSRPEVTEQKSGDSDGKPFNRFLKRRRQPVKSTTENATPEYQTEKKPVQNRYFSSQSRKQLSDTTTGNRKYGNQGVERTTVVSLSDFQARPTPGTYKPSKDRSQKQSEESDNSLQSEEEGPYPTGSAKTITQQLYRPNDLRTKDASSYQENQTAAKLEPKVDTSTVAHSSFDGPEPTQFSEESEVNPTVGYVKPSAEKSIENSGYTTFVGGDGSYTPFPTSLKYFDPTETPLPLASIQTFEPPHQQPIQHTTEFITLDDRYTSAFAEISKHHHIPGQHQAKSPEGRPSLGLSIELQAPFSDPYSQEQQSQSYSSEELVKPTQQIQYSGEYSSSVSSSNEYSGSVEYSRENGNEFDLRPTAPTYVTSHQTGNYVETTTNSLKVSPESSVPSSTEYSNNENRQQSTAGVTTLSAQSFGFQQNSGDFSSQRHESITEKSQSEDISKGTDQFVPTSLPDYSVESAEPSAETSPQAAEEENLGGGAPQKFSNPSVVRVKTRVRGKQRGQVNYSNSQHTTSTPYALRSKAEAKQNENVDEDYSGKSGYQQTGSKYNFRNSKKPLRPTVETTTDKEVKPHVFTLKHHRRVPNPSTVSTKRIRRPTTPLPTEESSNESNTYTPELEYPSSVVSNDVYYEQSNQSPGRSRYRKPYNSREQESDSVSGIRPTVQTYYEESSKNQGEEYSKENESKTSEITSEEVSLPKSQWSSTESGVLTTPEREAETTTEAKKGQDSKKAFDPDLEKKNGRRRVRVRVSKRPHENFETAESQNLRTVANILVPVTPAYKPADDANLQLAKNSETNYEGGQKSFGFRSREYFRKRLNLTLGDVSSHQQTGFLNLASTEQPAKETGEKVQGTGAEGGKLHRGKFRGYVRKVIKHPAGRKDGELKPEQTIEYNEDSFQHPRVQQGVFNQTGRIPGTRHKTFVRYVKKNRVKVQEAEGHQEKDESLHESAGHQTVTQEQGTKQEGNLELEQTTVLSQSKETGNERDEFTTVAYSETQETEEPEIGTTESYPVTEPEESHQTDEPTTDTTQPIDFVQLEAESSSVSPLPQPSFGKGATKLYPVPSQASKTSGESYLTRTTEVYPLKSTEGRVGYKNKFFQTLRPVYSRAPNTGILRIRDPPSPSTTEQSAGENSEKKIKLTKYKYGKVNSFGSGATNQNADDKKETGEQQTSQQNKSKNTYTYDVRKYTRGGSKTREGGFGKYNRNRYPIFGKPESASSTSKDEISESQETSEEITNGDYEATTRYTQTETEVESTTEAFRTTNREESVTTAYSSEEIGSTGSSGSSSSSSEENDDFFTTEKIETTSDDKIDISTLIYGTTGTATKSHPTTITTEGFTDSDSTSKEITEKTATTFANTQPDLYRFAKNSFSFDETEKFTGTKNRAYVRNITADILGFSAPGGTDQGNEIIVSSSGDKADSSAGTTETSETEVVTSYEKTDEPVTDDSTETQTTDSVTTTGRSDAVSVNSNAIEGQAGGKKVVVTVSGGVVTDDESNKTKVSKLLKTSTQTKVSHETEICYRGRCIRTKSENPDEDLKLLVDSAASESPDKIK